MDLPNKTNPVPEDFTVAVPRLNVDQLLITLSLFRSLFWEQSTDPDTGESKKESRIPHLQDVLAKAFENFKKTVQGQGDPNQFADYLVNTPGESEALALIQQLDELLNNVRLLGVTDKEFEISRNVLFRPIAPRGLTLDQLQLTIEAVSKKVAANGH